MTATFPWTDAELKKRAKNAIDALWKARADAAKAQAAAGRDANDSRAGKHLDAFANLMGDLALKAGFKPEEVRYRTGVEIPGDAPWRYRPMKRWDLIVARGNHLCAAIEFKSVMGARGKNLDNRSEAALGAAVDVWTAFKEGMLGDRPPWLGCLFVVRDEQEANAPVHMAPSTPPAEKIFRATSDVDRYGILCERMVRERVYSRAAYVATAGAKSSGWREPRPGLEVRSFLHAFHGHLVGWR